MQIEGQGSSYITLTNYIQTPQTGIMSNEDNQMDFQLNSETTFTGQVSGTLDTQVLASETDESINQRGEGNFTKTVNEQLGDTWGHASFDAVVTSQAVDKVVKKPKPKGKVPGKRKVNVSGKSNPSIVSKCRTNYREGISQALEQNKLNQERLSDLEKKVGRSYGELDGLFYPVTITVEIETAPLLEKAMQDLASALDGDGEVTGFKGDVTKAKERLKEVLNNSENIFRIQTGHYSQYYHMVLEDIIFHQKEVIRYREIELEALNGLIEVQKALKDQNL